MDPMNLTFTNNSTYNIKERNRGLQQQRNLYQSHEEVMALISCKHYEHIDLKQVIDPQTNMIFVIQWWNKFSKDL